MHWLYLIASVVCLALAMIRTLPTFAVLVFLAGALGFMVAWILGWLSSRIASQSRDVSHILGPDELRRMREQAQARKAPPSGPDSPP
jgi:predicted PurR-regulated permease PerM